MNNDEIQDWCDHDLVDLPEIQQGDESEDVKYQNQIRQIEFESRKENVKEDGNEENIGNRILRVPEAGERVHKNPDEAQEDKSQQGEDERYDR
jgi:hypothetical protein